jgi:hypothetical protein
MSKSSQRHQRTTAEAKSRPESSRAEVRLGVGSPDRYGTAPAAINWAGPGLDANSVIERWWPTLVSEQVAFTAVRERQAALARRADPLQSLNPDLPPVNLPSG